MRPGAQSYAHAAFGVELDRSGPIEFAKGKITARAAGSQIRKVIAFNPVLGCGIDGLVFQSEKGQLRRLNRMNVKRRGLRRLLRTGEKIRPA